VVPTLRFTELLNPKSEVRLMVEVLELPCVTENEVGLAEIVKSGTLTVTVNVVLWFRLRLLSAPFTVIL
jgi:hypothetical protein